MTPRYTVVEERLELLEKRSCYARHCLRLWRWIFYSLGLAAVVSAAAAGASSLADIWGPNAAGFLALAAAILTSVDKFIGASGSIARLNRRWQSFVALEDEVKSLLIDAREREPRLELGDDTALSAYDVWLTEKCARVDAAWRMINDRHDQV